MAEEVKETVDVDPSSSEEGMLNEDLTAVILNEMNQGYRDWSLDGKKYRTRFPTPKEDADARMAYAEAFNKALVKNLPTQKQMLGILNERGIWTRQDELELNNMREKINNIELILSKKDPKDKSKTTRKLAAELLEIRATAIEKSSQLGDYLNNTIEAVSEELKQAYYVATCTEYEDGSKVWATPEDYLNSKESGLVQTASYEYVTFTNGLAENYIGMLPEVQFLKADDDT